MALLGLVSAVGCGGDASSADPALPEVGVAVADAQAEADSAPTDSLQARRAYLTQWSRCLLRTGSRLERSWTRLGHDIDVEKLKLRNKDVQPFFDTLGPALLGSCPLGAAVPQGVPAELPTQGRAYVLAARGYGNRAAELRTSFDTKAYVTDEGEGLSTNLPGLQTAYTDAHESAQALWTTLDAALDAADRAWLDALGRAGLADSAPWHVTNTAVAGRAMGPCITAKRPMPPACAAARQAFTTARDGLERWRDAHRPEALGVFWLDVFRQRAADLEAAVAGLEAPVSKRKKTADEQLASASQRVDDARMALQNAANTVVFDFP